MSNDIVKSESGPVLEYHREGILDEGQVAKYEKLILVCDRNPNLDGRSQKHNTDFCLIKDKRGGEHIEPTRDFCLKAISVFGCSYEPVGPPMVCDDGNFKLVSRDVKVSIGDRYVVETGGCSTAESKESGARAFHDALARAMTRGMKRALEALVGLPFVNMMIKEVFGTYSVPEATRPIERQAQVVPSGKVNDLAHDTYDKLKKAGLEGVITIEERNRMWNKCLVATKDYNQLMKEVETIDRLLEERGGLR